MPPKKNKNQLNGFWLYAQKTKPRWRAQGLRVGSNDELLAIANPLWKQLSPAQRKEWDTTAREERRLQRGETDMGRLDNVGNIIGARRDPAEEARKRREREITWVTSQWAGKDVTQERLYFLDFQEMVELTESDNTVDREFLPRELAMVEYSLTRGILQFYHQLVWPGDIPIGFRFVAEKVAEEVHKIPAHKIDEDSDDYPSIWRKMLQVVRSGVKDGVYPPLYCLTQDYDKIRYLCDWMWARGTEGSGNHDNNPMGNVFSVEDLVVSLLAHSGRPGTERVNRSQITSRLDGSQWEFIPATTCDFHKERDVSRHCALAVVRRTAYTISDMVGMHYDIALSERHVPVREESEDCGSVARVLPRGSVPLYNHSKRRPGPGGDGAARGPPRQPARQPAQGGPNTYSQLSQLGARVSESSEEEEFVGHYMPQPRRMQPKSNMLTSSVSVMKRYHTTPDAPAGPACEQYDPSDWPSLGGAVPKSKWGPKPSNSSDLDQSDFPSLGHGQESMSSLGGFQTVPTAPMSQLTLSNASSVLFSETRSVAERGVGRGLPEVPAHVSGSNPGPGHNSLGRGGPLLPDRGVGRGTGPALGSGAPPSPGKGKAMCVGRGFMPGSEPSVGRGSMPSPGNGNASSVRSPASVGRGSMPSPGKGNASSVGSAPSVGRGMMPSAGRGGALPSVGGLTSVPPGLSSAPWSGGAGPQEVSESAVAGGDAGTGLRSPPGLSSHAAGPEDPPSVTDTYAKGLGAGGGGASPSRGRGYNPGGGATGVGLSRGRGYNPRGGASVGRGSLPASGR